MYMNREIKFRAWQKWHEYMFTPDYIDFINGNIIIGENDGDSRYEDIPLMQYTGLKDKNGKEIYEGDVLEFPFEMGIVYVINDGFRFAIKSFGSQTIEYESEEVLKQTKIIGNIYENPEFIQSSE